MATSQNNKGIKQPVPKYAWFALVCCIGVTDDQYIDAFITTVKEKS